MVTGTGLGLKPCLTHADGVTPGDVHGPLGPSHWLGLAVVTLINVTHLYVSSFS